MCMDYSTDRFHRTGVCYSLRVMFRGQRLDGRRTCSRTTHPGILFGRHLLVMIMDKHEAATASDVQFVYILGSFVSCSRVRV